MTQRRWKKKQPPPALTRDGEKIYYVKSGFSAWYMRAILASSQLFDLGLVRLEHFRLQKYYSAFFKAGRLVIPASTEVGPILMDIEDPPDVPLEDEPAPPPPPLPPPLALPPSCAGPSGGPTADDIDAMLEDVDMDAILEDLDMVLLEEALLAIPEAGASASGAAGSGASSSGAAGSGASSSGANGSSASSSGAAGSGASATGAMPPPPPAAPAPRRRPRLHSDVEDSCLFVCSFIY